MERNPKALPEQAAVENGEYTTYVDEVFGAVVTRGPINDAWRLTLWANCYNEPIFTSLAQEFDVGRDEFNVLSCLASYGSMVARTICDVTGRPKNSISRAVNRLVERKMLKRKTNVNDRRESLLILNEAGLRLYERVLPLAVNRQQLMLESLSKEERESLDFILNKLMRSRQHW
ncbi:Transcriptional regulator, MarR family [Candidatus Burkholderia verschuerenii]|uniref:Transcriptional regulator, MarR family n=1 Tax=Candidatus Burkholderia verschuerenii TaxID=242163 RepID=A0A0L0MBC4_9BURK|nr:MarR family transcriptional regulator [Candidatus Burkholderia verschuerenii]KND59643.1 Transcriptional regulator, MarR family [Candidatus Burkholderia verschuerenii]